MFWLSYHLYPTFRPSLYETCRMPPLTTPGYWAAVDVGVSASERGNVIGSLPVKFTSPYSSRASAVPCCWPGYHASTTAFTSPSHGIVTALPDSRTTTVFGLAAATAAMSASPLPSRDKLGRSANSPCRSYANTTATEADRAASAAQVRSLPSSKVTGTPDRARMASSGATGLAQTFGVNRNGVVHTVPALIPFVGVFDAVGPITATLVVPAPSGRMPPAFFSSTAPRSASAWA